MITKKISKEKLAEAKRIMRTNGNNHRDRHTGIVDLTSLTEETAAILDVYENSDYGIHDELFELAGELFAEDI